MNVENSNPPFNEVRQDFTTKIGIKSLKANNKFSNS